MTRRKKADKPDRIGQIVNNPTTPLAGAVLIVGAAGIGASVIASREAKDFLREQFERVKELELPKLEKPEISLPSLPSPPTVPTPPQLFAEPPAVASLEPSGDSFQPSGMVELGTTDQLRNDFGRLHVVVPRGIEVGGGVLAWEASVLSAAFRQRIVELTEWFQQPHAPLYPALWKQYETEMRELEQLEANPFLLQTVKPEFLSSTESAPTEPPTEPPSDSDVYLIAPVTLEIARGFWEEGGFKLHKFGGIYLPVPTTGEAAIWLGYKAYEAERFLTHKTQNLAIESLQNIASTLVYGTATADAFVAKTFGRKSFGSPEEYNFWSRTFRAVVDGFGRDEVPNLPTEVRARKKRPWWWPFWVPFGGEGVSGDVN